VVRASAILLLSRYRSSESDAAAFEGMRDSDALVRVAAVRSFESLPHEELYRLAPLLQDPLRAVRTEAARVLSAVPPHALGTDHRKALEAALAEYMAGQEDVEDQPAAHLNRAVVHANMGQTDRAKEEYLTALRIEPQFLPARINLAMLHDQLGQKADAEKEFRKLIELEPKLAEAHYSLGLLLAENEDRLQEASGFLATAARLSPQNARMHYNYGLALQRLHRPDEAEKALVTAYKLAPDAADYLHALTIFYIQQQRWTRAVGCAEELVRRHPNHPQFRSLLEEAKKGSGGKE